MARISTFNRPFTHTHTHMWLALLAVWATYSEISCCRLTVSLDAAVDEDRRRRLVIVALFPLLNAILLKFHLESRGSERSAVLWRVSFKHFSGYWNAETETALGHVRFIAENSGRLANNFQTMKLKAASSEYETSNRAVWMELNFNGRRRSRLRLQDWIKHDLSFLPSDCLSTSFCIHLVKKCRPEEQ
jgi:hypothetical protein